MLNYRKISYIIILLLLSNVIFVYSYIYCTDNYCQEFLDPYNSFYCIGDYCRNLNNPADVVHRTGDYAHRI